MGTTQYCDFIDDNCSVTAEFAAEPDAHGPLSFSFRPAFSEEGSALIDTNPVGGNDKAYVAKAVELLATLLRGWDLKDRHGELVKLNRDNIARVKRALLVKVIRKVVFDESPECEIRS